MNKRKALELLGLQEGATENEIKMAYRRNAAKWHPDKHQDNSDKKVAEEKFKEIKDAYEFLTNPSKQHGLGGGQDDFDLYEIFQSMMRGGREFNPNHHTIFRSIINISLKEAFEGCVKPIVINTESGPLTESIEIPAGIQDGTIVKTIEGKAAGGINTVYQFFVSIVSQEYEISKPTFINSLQYAESSGDLRGAILISPLKLILGGWEDYKAIDGATIQLRIPAGMEAGKILKVSGRGYWTDQRCRSRGSVYLRVVPKIEKLQNIDKAELFDFARSALYEIQQNSPEDFNKLIKEFAKKLDI